jgi:PQQ-dependent catabolism-associated CXXCW motif protein
MVRSRLLVTFALTLLLVVPAIADSVAPPWASVPQNTNGVTTSPGAMNQPPTTTLPPGIATQPTAPPPAMSLPPMVRAPAMLQPPIAPSPATPAPGFGFATPGTAPPTNAQPVRQNYADELTDFGVPPQSTLQQNVGSPTPLTIPGGHVITTAEIQQAVGSNILFFDVWNSGSPHPTIPGAIPIPGAGNPGDFTDQLQQQLWQYLAQATRQQAQQPIVFFCASSSCWESYNAALRAINMGFKTVLWYRGGLAAWQASGGQFVNPGQGQNAPAQPAAQPHIGFGQ